MQKKLRLYNVFFAFLPAAFVSANLLVPDLSAFSTLPPSSRPHDDARLFLLMLCLDYMYRIVFRTQAGRKKVGPVDRRNICTRTLLALIPTFFPPGESVQDKETRTNEACSLEISNYTKRGKIVQ